MCGGDEGDYKLAEPILEIYSKICRRIGDTGAGQKTKMCNQIAIAGLVQGLSEALHFAEKSGLDGNAVIEVISQGAAGSWQMSVPSDRQVSLSLHVAGADAGALSSALADVPSFPLRSAFTARVFATRSPANDDPLFFRDRDFASLVHRALAGLLLKGDLA